MATQILKKISEHLYIFQDLVGSRRLGALNEYQKQTNINKNVCYQACTLKTLIYTIAAFYFQFQFHGFPFWG